jgi:hypothetical protein
MSDCRGGVGLENPSSRGGGAAAKYEGPSKLARGYITGTAAPPLPRANDETTSFTWLRTPKCNADDVRFSTRVARAKHHIQCKIQYNHAYKRVFLIWHKEPR